MKISLTRNEIDKFDSLFIVNEINKDVSDCYLNFLDNAKEIATSNNHDFYNLFCKINEIDKDFIKASKDNNIEDSFVLLDIDKYINNPYNKNIKLSNIVDKNYQFKENKYLPYECFLFQDIDVNNNYYEHNKLGYFKKEYNYLSLYENDNIWMLITPHEINTMQKAIDKASGDVITFGLGLGYFAYMVSLKKEVKTVTIVEKNHDIIELFKKYILVQFEYKDKIKIVEDNALTYLDNNKTLYDYYFVDLYFDVNDGLPIYLNMYPKLLKTNKEFDFWIEKSFIVMLRRLIIDLLYEIIHHCYYKSDETYYDYLMEKINQKFKDKHIYCYKDILSLISEENIKELVTSL